ncbi:MAG: hypothetical protein M3N95_00205 [Actinomycetota bacterium]|nr:hypothetical protein [Actinomycetota bacterium]
MSPTEDQLRAALQSGQGPGIDPDAVISRAQAVRRERRVRYGSVAAVVAVVAGIGVAGGMALGSSQSHSTSTSRGAAVGPPKVAAGASPSLPGSSFSGNANGQNGQQPTAALAPAPGCPVTLPQLTVPNTAGASLFDGAVSAMTICVFPETGGGPVESGGHPLSTVLRGAAAARLAASLDSASKSTAPGACPLYLTAQGKLLVMIAARPDGTVMAPVEAHVLQNPCNLPVTNGTAVRYNWSPPASLGPLLGEARAIPVTPGANSGSPARS